MEEGGDKDFPCRRRPAGAPSGGVAVVVVVVDGGWCVEDDRVGVVKPEAKDVGV